MTASPRDPGSPPGGANPPRRNPFRAAFDWIGQFEFGVLASLLGLVLAVLCFIWVADRVATREPIPFDEWAIRALRRPDDPATPIGPRWLAEMGRDVTALGGVAFVMLLTMTVSGYLWLGRQYRVLALLLTSTVGGWLLSSVLKGLFERPRPDLVPHLSIVHTSSFPSGHSMMSAVVFLTIGTLLGEFVASFRLRAYFVVVAILLTILVGVSRVYMGVHYPTDVLAGWAAGLVWALGCGLFARGLKRRGLVETASQQGESEADVTPKT